MSSSLATIYIYTSKIKSEKEICYAEWYYSTNSTQFF